MNQDTGDIWFSPWHMFDYSISKYGKDEYIISFDHFRMTKPTTSTKVLKIKKGDNITLSPMYADDPDYNLFRINPSPPKAPKPPASPVRGSC